MKRITEDDLNLNGVDDFIEDGVVDTYVDSEDNFAEVELVAAEPTKITDIDGSVVIITPGDIVNVKSESLKRVSKVIESEEDSDEDKNEDDKEDKKE
jgi:hypothetical protein